MALTLVICILLFFSSSLVFLFNLHSRCSLSPAWCRLVIMAVASSSNVLQSLCVCVFMLCLFGHQKQIPPSHYIQLARGFLFIFATPTSQLRVVEGIAACFFDENKSSSSSHSVVSLLCLAFRNTKCIYMDSLHYILTFIFIICVLTKICVMFVSRLPAVWSHPQLTFLLSTSVCYISTAFIAKIHCHIK